ncbi:MAG: monofunctional biosynthetic peptidoglycan transglycosylase, partial [Desulfobacteraceae bacterium]
MSEKKKTKRTKTKKIVLLVLLGLLLALGLFAGYFFLSMPDVKFLKDQDPDTTAVIEQRKTAAKKNKQKLESRQKWVNFDHIPQLLRNTVLVSEDIDFYHHEGIDYYELKESIKRNLKEGKSARGGSTITQQLAKNLFLS